MDFHLRTIAAIRAVPVRQNKPRTTLHLLHGRDFGRPDRLPELVFAAEAEADILLARRRLSVDERKLTTNKTVTNEVTGDLCRVECSISGGQHFRGDGRERSDFCPELSGRVNVACRHGTVGERDVPHGRGDKNTASDHCSGHPLRTIPNTYIGNVSGIVGDIPYQSCDRILRGGLGYYGRPVSFRNLDSFFRVFCRLVRGTFGLVCSVANGVGLFESTFSVFCGLTENFAGVPEVLDLRARRRLGNRVTDLDYAAG